MNLANVAAAGLAVLLSAGQIKIISAQEAELPMGLMNQAPTGTITWDKSDNPHLVRGDLVVSSGSRLTIGPGVQVLFEKGANLVIEGDLCALGTPDDPILFTSASPQPAPGDWGNIRFVTADTTLSYDETGAYIKGSRLEYAVIEYGGTPAPDAAKEFLGGAIHCRKSSPYLRFLTLRQNLSLYGGGVYCHEFASPYIENCRFLENEANETGGGLACFFYANAVVKHNIFQANRAGEHGGGIYFSFSSPQILDNIIENNSAQFFGGGLCGSNTVTGAPSRIRNNVLLSNHSGKNANNLYVTAKLETVFQNNGLFSFSGWDVYIDALETDLDFRGNYFAAGAPENGLSDSGDEAIPKENPTYDPESDAVPRNLEARLHDYFDDPGQKKILVDPVLDAPPPDLPNVPTKIASFEICGDPEFATDWPYALCPEAPIYLQVRATDNNPYHPDWVPIRLRSSESDPHGVVALAWETAPSSGIFRLTGAVQNQSASEQGFIRAQIGEILFFSIEGGQTFLSDRQECLSSPKMLEISRRVDPPRSYITAFQLSDEADSLHVVNHQPTAHWEYRNIFGQAQTGYQLQLAAGSPFAAPAQWESGPQMTAICQGAISGTELLDGRTYALRLSLNCGDAWSDWSEMTLRMNSLPTLPQPLYPMNDQFVSQARPMIKLQPSTDAESDPVAYEIQLYQDAAFTRVLAIEKELRAAGAAAQWVPPLDLQDDAEYYWRARSRDPFETSPWAATGHFYVNSVEEPPLPFSLIDPPMGSQVFDLQPVFSWEKTVDPDPLSQVAYRLLISSDEQFLPANTIKTETQVTFQKADRPLQNDASYSWKVEAVDNTGRMTWSQQIGRFSVSTTPSAPQLLTPLAGEELHPDGKLRWSSSSDPDPEDKITYRIQIAQNNFVRPILDEIINATETALSTLPGYALLADDKVYSVRVRAEDDQGVASIWSKEAGSFFFNQVNTAPGSVMNPISPAGVVVSGAQPTICWGAASDADQSDPPTSLSYLIQFDRAGMFLENPRQVQVMAGVTQITVPDLADNTKWFYRICARDDEGALGAWTPAKSFVLNLQNDPPEPFSLIGPTDGLTTYKLNETELSWQAASDVDPEDQIHYLVHLSPAAGEPATIDGRRIDAASIAITTPLKNETEYLWWVEAVDKSGASTAATTKNHFTINTTPSVPQTIQVADGIWTGHAALHWQASTDPDPSDALTYEVQIVPADDPSRALLTTARLSSAKVGSGITALDLKGLKTLKDNEQYAFRVRAIDPHNAASLWSAPAGFALDLVNEAPTAPTILQPTPGLTRTQNLAVRWSESTDPDPTDKSVNLSYRLQMAAGESFAAPHKPDERVILDGAGLSSEINLADNRVWSLRLRAEDGRGGVSAWSNPVSIVVNEVDDPPSPPQLRAPVLGAVLAAPSVEFAWSASKDPDYKSVVSYQIRCWPEGSPEQPRVKDVGAKTAGVLSDLELDENYQWEVSGTDETGLKSVSALGAFRLRRPEIPQPQSGGVR